MCFRPFPTFSDLLLTLFIFTLIYIPIFWLFIVMIDCTITIALDSGLYRLLVISDPSDAILTSLRLFLLIFYLPLPFWQNNIVPHSPHLHKILYHLNLTQTVFYCILRHYPSYINLDILHSTLFYCVLLIILCFSSCFVGFTLISLDILVHTSDYIYGHTTHWHIPYLITIELDIHPFITPSSHRSYRNWSYQNFTPLQIQCLL